MSRILIVLLGILGLIGAMGMVVWWALVPIRSDMPLVKPQHLIDVSAPSPSAKIIEGKESSATKSSEAPDWVGAPPGPVGDAYQMSIVVGPYTTRAECDAQLPEALQEALDRYVEVCLGEEVHERIILPTDYLRQLVKDQWEEVREYSVGTMTRLHVLIEFDRKAKDRVLDEHRWSAVAGRLWFAGVGWTAWLALLGVVYGYLRITGRKSSSRPT